MLAAGPACKTVVAPGSGKGIGAIVEWTEHEA